MNSDVVMVSRQILCEGLLFLSPVFLFIQVSLSQDFTDTYHLDPQEEGQGFL
uniref:Uncharacterized protein n=1 Tax=Arion vulgaris TaxID=1028688 RepID=A0A0B6ZNF2_9EUPU